MFCRLSAAQDDGQAFDPYPLRPADTSSPRDTLRSFDQCVNEAHQAFLTHLPEEYIERPTRRALETFDFSQLAQRGRKAKEIESLLLMKEVLDRIELPPDEEIPGDAEAEEQGLAQWTIPNTRITIGKV
jgi:MscS family membrane protein